MKKWIWLFLFTMSIMFTGCDKTQKEQDDTQILSRNEIYMYYVNSDFSDVEKQIYQISLKDEPAQNAERIMQGFINTKQSDNSLSPIPKGIEYVSNTYDKRSEKLTLYCNVFYDELQAETFLFFKTCVVKTLLQLEHVNKVAIVYTDMGNPDSATATTTENFDADSFAMAFGNSNGYEQKGNIILYFATEDGKSLKEYHKQVKISNNTSLAELVVSSIMDGPKQEGYQATVSPQIDVRNVSVKDGICYVDFNEDFFATDSELRNDIIVYSIVNSLVELPTVSKVQFLQNGEKQPFFRETMPFDGLFERNLDLIESEGKSEEHTKTDDKKVEKKSKKK